MQYRRFGKLDWQGSALGFGCMRLPTLSDDHSQIDEDRAGEMIRYAIDHGVTYFDSAYFYHGGESERFLGRVLSQGLRDKVRLATKMPMGSINEASDLDRILNDQLAKLQTDHIDFYLFHGMRHTRIETLEHFDGYGWADRALADGRIRHIGFSFHDTFDVLKQIIDSYHWDFCQVQYNYMDINNQAGTRGVQYAASQGLGVVVMEPLLGGRLVDPPASVQAIWDKAPIRRSPADWALQWVWNQPEVSVVLSGMSTLQQVTENVESASNSDVGQYKAQDLAVIDEVRTMYQSLCPIPCTKCEYCLPCTVGLNIPRLFDILNRGVMFNKIDDARRHYARLADAERAAACIQCRTCEEKCPQTIPISEWMGRLEEILMEGRDLEACLSSMNG